MRYEVIKDADELKSTIKVWDTVDKVWITTELPSIEIANEICDDFNKMDKGNYAPIIPNA